MSEIQLLPCPICNKSVSIALGGNRDIHHYFITRGKGKDACKCRLFMESEQFYKDASRWTKQTIKDELIKAWNTRKSIEQIEKHLSEDEERITKENYNSQYIDGYLMALDNIRFFIHSLKVGGNYRKTV